MINKFSNLIWVMGLFLFAYSACKHKPVSGPLYIHDTLAVKKSVYVFKDSLVAGAGSHKTPVYGSSGDTIKDSVCFNEEILPIFVSNCAKAGCHNSTTHKDGYQYISYNYIRSYVTPGSPTSGKTMSKIISGSMPPSSSPPRLTTTQKSLIEKWISQGAKNNIDCGMGCDTTVFTYSGVIST